MSWIIIPLLFVLTACSSFQPSASQAEVQTAKVEHVSTDRFR